MSASPGFPVPGRLFPVCCAAVRPAKIVDNPITITVDLWNVNLFVFLDRTTGVHSDETKLGDWIQPTSAHSPFIGKSPMERYLLLRQLISNTASDVNHEHFAIVDERTLQDGSILLIDGPWGKGEDEGVARAVRVVPEIAQERLLLYNIGEPEIDKDQAAALKAYDGVLRVGALRQHPLL
ncbi:hypothetical protein CERZMDRAFT_99473 [Cercospora zeae-maydis SCOH1-5]|uniref:Uncharacterized protein n=1 Tax=Cercospora zeae-maydis SCOH1-5 TaxID=717836 RepID=A0A6A6FAG9_9PEZI|nr:hypothetical protein CERZMDRAFT_99473 [Cercospora zeae-maydis SCOH1-5]